MKKLLSYMISAALLVSFAGALALPAAAQEAADITASTTLTGEGYSSFGFLTDGNTSAFRTAEEALTITLENAEGMAGLYLIFDLEYGAYTVTDNTTGQQLTAGRYGMLHEYIDLQQLGTLPTSVTLSFPDAGARLSELTVYTEGELPVSVQRWDAPLEDGADLVLFSAHGDDEHLYFAGLLPYYAGQLGYRVQVVYLTDHRNDTNARTHEMLNGLWNVGVRAYPVFGSFADFRIDSLSGTYQQYEQRYGTTEEALLDFVVTQIRRFKPLVAVGHDLDGEYGHGMHQVYADLLTQAVTVTNDPEVCPDSAEQYGLWEIPKLYLHLYETNAISLDYDQPLDAFDGMTAFQVSQEMGFPSHKSQQWPMFVNWFYGTNRQITHASQIQTYSPCEFGLYHTTVGEDVEKNDFFENLKTYDQQEQERLEQERLEQERLEQERLEQERLEQERLEQERLEQEKLEQERLEQEHLAQEEQARLAQEQLKQEQRTLLIWGSVVFVLALLLVAGMYFYSRYHR